MSRTEPTAIAHHEEKDQMGERLPIELQQAPATLEGGEGGRGFSLVEEEPFSVFMEWQKRWISFAASFGALFSTLSSYIYLPALVPMARDLGVTLTLLNLTVTSYLIVSGLAPAFMGDMADQSGRRPVYILMFTLMVGANIGMALQNSYPVLLVLRMLQSAGASGTYGAAYGVVADIAEVAERGSYVGTLIFFTTTAPMFGPVLGGIFTEKLSWRWIFYFLVILSGTHFILLLPFLPETQRKRVGNGSKPVTGIYRSLFSLFVKRHPKQTSKEDASVLSSAQRHHFPNPLSCLPILFHKGSISVILVGSITYTVKMTLQTSLAAQCIDIYSLDYLQAGLIYLPSGIGGAIASTFTGTPIGLLPRQFFVNWLGIGRFLDKNLRKQAKKMGREELRRGGDISGFPIETTRFQGIYILTLISVGGTVGYGVALMTQAHISVMLVMQFITGATTSSIFTMCGTLLTDLNPHRSATAQAAYNLVRCIGAGVGIAALNPLVNAIGSAWTFAIYSILLLLVLPAAWLLRKHGLSWRNVEDAA